MSERVARRATAGASITLVLAATLITLGAGVVVKEPCASGDWSDGRQYRRFCYSDIVPLLGTEHLTGGRLPYLDTCPASAGQQCDEYPVLTMYFMRASAWLADDFAGFFHVNALLLGILALVTAAMLYAMAGLRAMYFALAPTLLIYAFVNWDLLAVALATAATLAYVRRRDGASGVLIGLGAAAKLYPVLLLVPFALGRLREKRKDKALSLAVWTVLAYGAVNLPFALLARHSWATFFRFNTDRAVDWDSLWFVTCTRLHGGATGCDWSIPLINTLSLVLFAALAALLYWARARRHPEFPRWTFGFPLIAAFLLTNKVYSPQYGLWLLPWFALTLPSLPLFAAFEAADVAVFITRFSWFGRLSDLGGLPIGAFQVALVARDAILVLCLVAWVLRSQDERLPLPAGALRPSFAGLRR
ncbi:MAG TPA: glycosyltransferase 87 family protein [Actinomycetota bacterium]